MGINPVKSNTRKGSCGYALELAHFSVRKCLFVVKLDARWTNRLASSLVQGDAKSLSGSKTDRKAYLGECVRFSVCPAISASIFFGLVSGIAGESRRFMCYHYAARSDCQLMSGLCCIIVERGTQNAGRKQLEYVSWISLLLEKELKCSYGSTPSRSSIRVSVKTKWIHVLVSKGTCRFQ